jgi:hypothetical protein
MAADPSKDIIVGAYLQTGDFEKGGAVMDKVLQTTNSGVVKFETEIQTANRLLKEYADSLNDAAGKHQSFTDKIVSGFRDSAIQVMAFYAAAQGTINFLKDSINTYAEHEAAGIKMNAMLKASGRGTSDFKNSLNELNNQIDKNTRFERKDAEQAEARLMLYEKLSDDQIPKIINVSKDLATLMGGSLADAASALGMAMEAPETAGRKLRSMGIVLTKTEREYIDTLVKSGEIQQAQAFILNKTSNAVKGLSDAADNSTEGSLRRFAKGWEDFKVGFAGAAIGLYTAINWIMNPSKNLDDINRSNTATIKTLNDELKNEADNLAAIAALETANALRKKTGFEQASKDLATAKKTGKAGVEMDPDVKKKKDVDAYLLDLQKDFNAGLAEYDKQQIMEEQEKNKKLGEDYKKYLNDLDENKKKELIIQQEKQDAQRKIDLANAGMALEAGKILGENIGKGQAGLKNALKGELDLLIDYLEKKFLIDWVEALSPAAFLNPMTYIQIAAESVAFSAAKSAVSSFATGTRFAPGGMAMVGEAGPEFVNLPRGSQVINNAQSSSMNMGGININIGGNATPETVQNLKMTLHDFGRNLELAMRNGYINKSRLGLA